MYTTVATDARAEMPRSEMPKSMPQMAGETSDFLRITIEKTNEIIKIMYGEDLQIPQVEKVESLEDVMKLNLGLCNYLMNNIEMLRARLCV